MKDLPFAVRLFAIAGLTIFFVSAALVLFEGSARIYGTAIIDLVDHASVAGMWAVCILAGIVFVWRDRFERSETSDTARSRVRGVIALVAAIFLATLGIAILFYGGLLIRQPGEIFTVQHFAALPAGLLLASVLSLVRALSELRAQ